MFPWNSFYFPFIRVIPALRPNIKGKQYLGNIWGIVFLSPLQRTPRMQHENDRRAYQIECIIFLVDHARFLLFPSCWTSVYRYRSGYFSSYSDETRALIILSHSVFLKRIGENGKRKGEIDTKVIISEILHSINTFL